LLHGLGVGGYFFEIVAGDSGYPQKPSPDTILRTLRRESIAPSEALMVGDSLIDIETACRAGIEIVVLSHGFSSHNELESTSPNAIVRDFHGFLKLAKKKGW
jgi:phosphoglycolate phosphatase